MGEGEGLIWGLGSGRQYGSWMVFFMKDDHNSFVRWAVMIAKKMWQSIRDCVEGKIGCIFMWPQLVCSGSWTNVRPERDFNFGENTLSISFNTFMK